MLKPYSVHVRDLQADAAMLVYAHNGQEARVIGYRADPTMFDDEFISVVATLLHADWLKPEQGKAATDTAHVVWDVPYCIECGFWGHSPINDEGFCEDCRREQ